MDHLTFVGRFRRLRHKKTFTKYFSGAVFTGKAKTINWIAINLMLKYSDMFLEGCRKTKVAP